MFRSALAYTGIVPATRSHSMTDMTAMPRRKNLPPEAQRALAEAGERGRKAKDTSRPKEMGGPEGLEPVRYGDWERKGVAVDF